MSKAKLIKEDAELKGVRERFAECITEYAIHHNLTIKQLSAKWKFNESQLSQLLHGGKTVTIRMLLKGKEMGLDIDYILFNEGRSTAKSHLKKSA